MHRINLLPPDEKRRVNVLEILVSILFISFIGMVIMLYAYNYYQVQILNAELSGLQAEYKSLEPAVREVEEIQDRKEALERRLVFREIFHPRFSWAEFLKELGFLVPEGIRFNQLSVDRQGRLSLDGETSDHHMVSAFMDELEESSYFRQVVLEHSTSTWRNGDRLTRFSLRMEVIREDVQEVVF